MGLSMLNVIRRTVRPAASLLVVVVVLLSPLTCATSQRMAQGHEACCAAMGQECSHPMAALQDCCSIDASRGGLFTPAPTVKLSAPVALPSTAGVATFADLPAVRPFAHVDSFHRPGSTRVYLLVSALLI
jgi:hypothetical protein